MFEQLKQNWESLKNGRPGSRFQEQYEQRTSHPSPAGRVLRIAVAVVTLLLGLFFLPAPGPGFIVVGIGALLIAREFRTAAIVLDHIEVRARQDDDNVVVEVHDNGPGIPAELQPMLFERFSSASRESSNGRQRNTGLGLYFCKLAIEAHGGSISVHSHPSSGTTFMISLPSKVVATSAFVASSSYLVRNGS